MQNQHDLTAQALSVCAASKADVGKQGPTVLTSLEMKLVSGGSPKTFWAVATDAPASPKTFW